MATFYYKGLVHNSRKDAGSSRSGYVSAKSKKEALLKITEKIGRWYHDSISVWNGTTGKVVCDSMYDLPIAFSGGKYIWMGK